MCNLGLGVIGAERRMVAARGWAGETGDAGKTVQTEL